MQDVNISKLRYAVELGDFDTFKRVADLCSDEELSNLSIRTMMKYGAINYGQAYNQFHCYDDEEVMMPVLHYLSKEEGYKNSRDKIKYLLDRGYDVNKADENGYTALAYALDTSDFETGILLLEHKANPFSKSPWAEYETVYDCMFDKDGNYYDSYYPKAKHAIETTGWFHGFPEEKMQQLQEIRELCKPELKEKPFLPAERILYIMLEGEEREISSIGKYDSKYLAKVSGHRGDVMDIVYINETKMKRLGEIKDKKQKRLRKNEFLRYLLKRKEVYDSFIKKEGAVYGFVPTRAERGGTGPRDERDPRLNEAYFEGEPVKFLFSTVSHVSPQIWEGAKKNYSMLISAAEKMQEARRRSDSEYQPKDRLEEKAQKFAKNKDFVIEMFNMLEKEEKDDKLSHDELCRRVAERNYRTWTHEEERTGFLRNKLREKKSR